MWNWVLADPYQPCKSVHLVSGFPNLHSCHKGGNFRGLTWSVGFSEDKLVLKRSIDWAPRLGQAVVTLHEYSVAQLCLTLGDPMNCSPPCCYVHGILQAIILEWVAMPSSRGIFLTQGLNCYLSFNLHNRKRLKSLAFICIIETEAWTGRITYPGLQFMKVAEQVIYTSFSSDGLLLQGWGPPTDDPSEIYSFPTLLDVFMRPWRAGRKEWKPTTGALSIHLTNTDWGLNKFETHYGSCRGLTCSLFMTVTATLQAH